MRAQSRRKKGLARTPFKRDKKKFYREKRAVFKSPPSSTHTVVIYFYKVDTHTRHYKREIACSVVLRAPFRRTSPNLQRPFLLGFFTFPSFASFVCFRAHLLLRFKKSFICLEDLLLRLFFASFFFGRSTHPPLRSHTERGLRWVRGTSRASLSS